MYTCIISIALSYKHILCIEIAYTNYLTSSLDIYIDKTLVSNFNTPFAYPFINRRPYYSGSLSLNRSIDLTSISLLKRYPY